MVFPSLNSLRLIKAKYSAAYGDFNSYAPKSSSLDISSVLSLNLLSLKYATPKTYIACGALFSAAISIYSMALFKSRLTPSPL